MTADIINFNVERAKRKSGLNDQALLKDMVAEGFDPCDSVDIQNYYQWKNFQEIIVNDVDTDSNWSDEALDRLFADIRKGDPTKTYTIDYSIDDLIAGDDFNLEFSTKPEEKG